MAEVQKARPTAKLALRWARFLAITYVIILVLFVIAEPWMIYPGLLRTSIDIPTEDPNLKLVDIPTPDDEILQGLLYSRADSRGLVILCHGNGDLICFMPDEVKALSERFNVSVLTFDYRGYGYSEGFPTAERLYVDGQAVYDFAISLGYNKDNIVVFGRSLGGAVAISIVENNPVAGLGIRSSFSKLSDLAAARFPWLPVKLLIRNDFPSAEKFASYSGPLVQMHGKSDGVIPIRFGRELHASATSASPKTFIPVEGFHHNGPTPKEFWSEFGKMLDHCLPESDRAND